MTFFVYIRECVKHGSSVQDKQDLKTQFLLTQKIKNKVWSTYKNIMRIYNWRVYNTTTFISYFHKFYQMLQINTF